MGREKKNVIQLILLVIILIIVVIFAIKVLGKNNKKQEHKNTQKQEGTTAIDKNDKAYEGMKIYEENGETIIEGKDGSKTIETTKTKEDTGLVETTKEEKQKYEISNVSVSARGGGTIITGKVKNNDSKSHTLIINIKFYSDNNRIKGSTSTKLEVDKGNTKDFTMSIMDDVSQCKYNIEVEYAK